MTDDQIKHMVDRFLQWKLPADFAPDNGITFEQVGSKGTPYEYVRTPVGTNLLTATQAEAMVRHMLEGMPPSDLAQHIRTTVLQEALEAIKRMQLPPTEGVSDEEAWDDGFDQAIATAVKELKKLMGAA